MLLIDCFNVSITRFQFNFFICVIYSPLFLLILNRRIDLALGAYFLSSCSSIHTPYKGKFDVVLENIQCINKPFQSSLSRKNVHQIKIFSDLNHVDTPKIENFTICNIQDTTVLSFNMESGYGNTMTYSITT